MCEYRLENVFNIVEGVSVRGQEEEITEQILVAMWKKFVTVLHSVTCYNSYTGSFWATPHECKS